MANILKPRSLPQGVSLQSFEEFNWEDVLARAREHLQQVREQAQRLVEDAKAEVEAIKKVAAEDGRQAAMNQVESLAATKAVTLAEQKIGKSIEAAERLTAELAKSTEVWLRQWQHETIPLAVAIAERLVRRQIDLDPSVLLQWVSDAVSLARAESQLDIRIHPSDRQRLGPHLDRLTETASEVRKLRIVEDDSVQSPGVIVEGGDLRIDAQLTSQLDRLVAEMR